MPWVTNRSGAVTAQDPDIAALTARLGLRGMHYHSFGNRPVPAMPVAVPPDAPATAPPPATPPRLEVAAPPAAAPVVPTAAAWGAPVAAPPTSVAEFPLIAAALGRAAASPAATEAPATLAFLGLRARIAPGR